MVKSITSLLIILSTTSFVGSYESLNIWVSVLGISFTLLLGILYFVWTRSRQLLNAIPGVWTSLGILGTFIAIVNTLGGGVEQLTSEAENLNQLVNELVRNIIPAFTTSIIGICGAIITSLIIKVIYAQEEKTQEKKMCQELRKEVRFAGMYDTSPEMMVVKLLGGLQTNNLLLQKILQLEELQQKSIDTFATEQINRLQQLYDKIYETNKEHAKILIQEYLQGAKQTFDEAQKSFNQVVLETLVSHTKELSDYFTNERDLLKSIADEAKEVITSMPNSIDNAKESLVTSITQAIEDQYEKLIERNSNFIKQLLKQVEDFEKTFSSNTQQAYGSRIDEIVEQINKLATAIQNSLSQTENTLSQASQNLNEASGQIASSVVDSSEQYAALVSGITNLISAIESQRDKVNDSNKVAESTLEKLKNLITSLEELAKNNQQLRYELTQWKRVHRKVKINDEKGTKECPNCHEENQMEANFCRKCAYPFWDNEPIKTQMKK